MANQGGSESRQSDEDDIAWLQSAVMHLQQSISRRQAEPNGSIIRVQETLVQVQERVAEMRKTLSRHHRERMEHVGRIAEILAVATRSSEGSPQ